MAILPPHHHRESLLTSPQPFIGPPLLNPKDSAQAGTNSISSIADSNTAGATDSTEHASVASNALRYLSELARVASFGVSEVELAVGTFVAAATASKHEVQFELAAHEVTFGHCVVRGTIVVTTLDRVLI